MQPFVEQVLDLGYDYGATGGPLWSTTISESGGGTEKANVNWSQPKGRWELGDRSGENCLTLDQHEYIYGFWMARRGQAIGFRYKDWGDYQLNRELIGTGDGTKTQFQVTKTYGDFVRILKKLDSEGFQIETPGAALNYALNPTTGVVTFGSALPTGTKIYATGEFHVPVRFEQDEWPGRFYAADPDRGQRYYELGSLSVRAIRV